MRLNDDINTEFIAQNFANSHAIYAQNAPIQALISKQLAQALSYHVPSVLNQVLEIGCGTGNLTDKLCQNHHINTLYLNDLYDKITQNHPPTTAQIKYLIADIQTALLPDELDLVASSSCLQWVKDLSCVCHKVQRALVPEGVFGFSSFGTDNFTQIKSLTNQGLDYYNLTELGQLVRKAGFKIEQIWEQKYTLYFDSPRAVLKHIQQTGVSVASDFRWNKHTLDQFYRTYQERFGVRQGETWRYPLTYHAVFCVARKKGSPTDNLD